MRITIIQGHPDPAEGHFDHALADAYASAAERVGHEVRCLRIAGMDFDLVRSKTEWDNGEPPECIRAAQEAISWAQHVVIIYPLWLGSMPALLKAFLEQTLRPGFAISRTGTGGAMKKLLGGRSARIIVTMGMPAFIYRWYFGAHSLKSLERNILKFCGIGPIRASLIGMVETPRRRAREKWLAKMQLLGAKAR
ncbi:MAG: NAD(P)H-dependent oxidoreductase [Betaproteobacteria bacterium]